MQARLNQSAIPQIIISGTSDAGVLTDDGLLNYARAIGL